MGSIDTLVEVMAPGLSPRRRETAILLLRGHLLKEISREMGISIHTVNIHCRTVYKTARVHGQRDFLAAALSRVLGDRGE